MRGPQPLHSTSSKSPTPALAGVWGTQGTPGVGDGRGSPQPDPSPQTTQPVPKISEEAKGIWRSEA